MDAGAGNVIIKPLSGQLTHDTDSWGKMDPYCKIKIGAQTEKSKECTDGGKFPSWTDTLTFRRDKEDLINIEVWDADVGKDDLIGQGALAMSTVFNNSNKYNGWVDLTYKGKSAGKLLIDVQYFPDKAKTTTSTTSTTIGYTMGSMPTMTVQMQPTMMQPTQFPTTSIYTQPTVYPTQQVYQPTQSFPTQQVYPTQSFPTQQVYQQPTQTYPTQQVYTQQQYPTQQVYQQPTQQVYPTQSFPTQQVYQQPTQTYPTQQVYPTQQQYPTQQVYPTQQTYPTQQQPFGYQPKPF